MALRSRRFAPNNELQKAAQNSPPFRVGSQGKAVGVMQATLVELGFAMPITTHHGVIRADGIYGSETQAVVRAFQAAQALSVDGVAGHDTLHRLDEIQAIREDVALAQEALTERMMSLWT